MILGDAEKGWDGTGHTNVNTAKYQGQLALYLSSVHWDC
jgi:hypothetical protein